jgi:hypothetical protein
MQKKNYRGRVTVKKRPINKFRTFVTVAVEPNGEQQHHLSDRQRHAIKTILNH